MKTYGYRLYHGTEFCALGVSYPTQSECMDAVRERFESPQGVGYYTHAEIVSDGVVLQTVNNGATIEPSTKENPDA